MRNNSKNTKSLDVKSLDVKSFFQRASSPYIIDIDITFDIKFTGRTNCTNAHTHHYMVCCLEHYTTNPAGTVEYLFPCWIIKPMFFLHQ